MVSSAVFSDLAATPLTVALVSKPEGSLAEAICRMAALPSGKSAPVLSQAVASAAQRLIQIVATLCAPEGGWPADLPKTPENLAPYVGEELDELVDVLAKAGAEQPNSAPDSTQTQLLSACLPSLLSEIAGSGYEIMRLLEGIQARLYQEPDVWETGIVRLVPVLTLQTDGLEHYLDLVTQTKPQANWLKDEAIVQLAEGDLVGSLCPVERWVTTLTRQVRQQAPNLASLLDSGWPVEALIPGEAWCQGKLFLQFYLVMEASFEPFVACEQLVSRDRHWEQNPLLEAEQVIEAIAISPSLPFDSLGSDLEKSAGQFTLDDFASAVEVRSHSFTLDDFAETVAETSAAAPQAVASPEVIPSQQEALSNPGALVLLPRPTETVGDELLAAWVTLVDETWIQRFLQTTASELFCQKLSHALALEKALPSSEGLVEAAYQAVETVVGTDDLFKHTFVHQPLLLADLWPRLRWYLTRTSQTLMQMMSGLPIQWLVPGTVWQQGTLVLKTFALLQFDHQDWYLDLINGQVLTTQPAAIPADALIYSLTPELGKQPLDLAQMTASVKAQLEQPARSLAAWLEGVTIDLHHLESVQANQAGRLQIIWQFSLQPEP